MKRYFPSIKQYSWIVLVCLVLSLIIGFVIAKAIPPVYNASAMLVIQAGTTGTYIHSGTISVGDSINESSNDAAEIPSTNVMQFVYNMDPKLKERGYTADDLVLDVAASNPSSTSATIQLTSSTDNFDDAILLANDAATGYKAYKDKQIQDELNTERQTLQNEYNNYQQQSQALEKQILSYSNSNDPHIALLDSDRNSVIQNMNTVQSELIQLPASVHSDVYIVQLANDLSVTSASKTTLIVAITGGVGLLLGILIMLFMVFLDNRLRGDDEVTEKLGLSYLGGLANSKEIKAGSVPSSGAALQQLGDIAANLRLAKVLPGPWRAPQGAVLLLTSAQEAEGKTTVATGLATSVARSGRSVLVIDGNVRRPGTHLAFGMGASAMGLSSLLKAPSNEGIDAAVQRTNVPNVWLMPAGATIEDPMLLLEQRLPAILSQLRGKTDWIIIDGPSVLSGADASLMASMVDGVALVVDERHDKLPILQRARDVLKSLTDTPVGVILNRTTRSRTNPYYAVAYTPEVDETETKTSANGYEPTGNGNRQDSIPPVSRPLSLPGTLPMDMPIMAPNPPSPFPTPRRMDMNSQS